MNCMICIWVQKHTAFLASAGTGQSQFLNMLSITENDNEKEKKNLPETANSRSSEFPHVEALLC